ncbi:MAG: ABC transporter permease [Chloroflexi bacterium]|nr:ABC transporter permease [Chloroflexota bacterium]
MRALPGDIVLVIAGDAAVSPLVRETLREELGLNDPLHVQYGRWLWSMVNGEFGGRSLETREPIRAIVGRQLPVTLLLAAYTLLLSVVVSAPLGVAAAAWHNRWPDRVIRIATLGGIALPSLWVAIMVLLALLLVFRWSPPVIYSSPWADPRTHLQMAVWPTLVLSWEYGAHLVRVTRSSMLEALGQQYVAAARGKGLPEHHVILRHALPNALVPFVTMLGLQFGGLLSGTLILETIFGLPGVGRGLVQAALARDYPVVQSLATLFVSLSLVVSLAVDVTYARIDPRISHSP